jgi:subtilisin family serine protease
MRRLLLPLLVAVPAIVLAAHRGGQAPAPSAGGPVTEVVVTLAAPPLAYAGGDRGAAAQRIAAQQARFLEELRSAVPSATTRWRYRTVTNGFAVVLPQRSVPLLQSLPGVRDVATGTSYGASSTTATSAGRIGEHVLWGPGRATAGQGVKIAVIDDGVDQKHPFFSPAGYTMPEGFPKGQTAYTTAKVIVARSFPPPDANWRYAARPFDPQESSHATHVAGIAAGNFGTRVPSGGRVSGVAPRAYIGNYKALTVPTASGLGLNGNAPELVAAIEAAVNDGMDVLNLSLGEPEVDPDRDVVARALDAAAAAGVVPVVAAGNSFDELGAGSVGSPGSSARAITVAASEGGPEGSVASFSSAGPTPISLRLKPDVTAPGSDVLSSVPDGWERFSGTSMATPHVSGLAALLLQRHRDWGPDEIKSAIVATAHPLGSGATSAPTRIGAGLVDPVAADRPLLWTNPTSVSFGLLDPGQLATAEVEIDDADNGAGEWRVTVVSKGLPRNTVVDAPHTVTVPGVLDLTALAGESTGPGAGVVLLRRRNAVRRLPFWLRVSAPALAAARTTPLRGAGLHHGDTRGRRALVTTYRYPEVPVGGGITARLAGPEQVFRVRLPRPVVNFGVAVVARDPGVTVEPRVVSAGDESRLTGVAGLPVNNNPYLDSFGAPVLAAGATRADAGVYDVVFDSRTRLGAGRFTFRFWVDDVTAPRANLVAASVARGRPFRIRVTDTGSGVDPGSVRVTLDGLSAPRAVRGGSITVPTGDFELGRHVLLVRVSDFQETRNDENVARILPNTRTLRAVVTVR